MKQKKQQRSAGNYGKPDLSEHRTPVNLTNPLTTYVNTGTTEHQQLELPERNVLRLREFDIQNKK